MLGTVGSALISASFLISILALFLYYFAAQKEDEKLLRWSNIAFGLKGLLLVFSSAILIKLIFNHDFSYYYVYNYTSLDLQPKYLFSAFYGGQEGSFMLWILFSWVAGLGLMKWTRAPYKAPVMFFLTLTQAFLIFMIIGWEIGGINLGADPFRTFAAEFPDIPVVKANPDFAPQDGRGLNDLLKSPWMMIHPPILFVGFAMMTIPYCFAMAALWKKKYNDWVGPALPWTLGANLSLLTAIFLGGYWAYVTLSFGGFWAWDPVENASLVPWLIGTAGIHTMIIQRKSAVAQKSSIFFAILAYMAIVYETFLTRSGILSDASVHSFVDLGLYNQLLVFMLVISILGVGLFLYRYKELPSPTKESKILSREFMTFSGAVMLFVLGVVIILGTSSPIIGKLFTDRPTPPEISFYNDWSMPIAIVMALLTVIGQYLFWKKQDSESLASDLVNPLLVTSVVTILSVIIGNVRDLYYMLYFFAGWFAVIGNSFVIVHLAKKQPKLIGGALTHVGFGALLIGSLASGVYNKPMVDQRTKDYNAAVERGEVKDEEGFTIRQKVDILELKLGQPKIVNDKYVVTYEGYSIDDQNRPGQQTYKIKFEPVAGGNPFYLFPEVYPMLATSSSEGVNWSVDPDVHTGLLSDIYLYVSGSQYVEQRNNFINEQNNIQTASDNDAAADSTTKLTFSRGESRQLGAYNIRFVNYVKADSTELPEGTILGVKAEIEVSNMASGQLFTVEPLFAVLAEGNFVFAPPMDIPEFGMSVAFSRISTQEDRIELSIEGVEDEQDWVLISAEQKPFISVVWFGTFMLMGGFSISIFRHWGREKKNESVE